MTAAIANAGGLAPGESDAGTGSGWAWAQWFCVRQTPCVCGGQRRRRLPNCTGRSWTKRSSYRLAAGAFALEPGASGIDHLTPFGQSLQPQDTPITLADGSSIDSQGSFLEDGRGNFLLRLARDGSVRVVNVGDGYNPNRNATVNAQYTLANLPPDTGCFPVNPAARRPLAQGPGIRIPRFRLGTRLHLSRATSRRRLAGRPDQHHQKIHQHWPASSRSC